MPSGTRLTLDRIACNGHGICALMAPSCITLDRWGYPVVSGEELEGKAIPEARRAARACPAKALKLC